MTVSGEGGSCDGWRESSEHFPYFHPTSAELESLGYEVAREDLAGLIERLSADHRHVTENVGGVLDEVLEPEVNQARDQAGRFLAETMYVKCAVRSLGQVVDAVNDSGPTSVVFLNRRYRELKASNFGVYPGAWEEAPSDAAGGDVVISDQTQTFEAAVEEARSQHIAELNGQWCQLSNIVEAKAIEIASMIEQGSNEDNLRRLFDAGAMTFHVLTEYFPDFAAGSMPGTVDPGDTIGVLPPEPIPAPEG